MRVTPIVFLGRSGDRNDRAMAGAAALGRELAGAMRVPVRYVGQPAPPLGAPWNVELEAARSTLAALGEAVAETLAQGGWPLTVAGRCAASLATLPVVARARPDAAIVWFDAHGDCNTPESSSTGYLGGMVHTGAAGLWNTGLGSGLDLSRLVLVGSRDLDPAEETLIGEYGIRMVAAGPQLPERLRATLGGRPSYVHLDCDVLEPGIVPSDYDVPDGLSLRDLQSALAAIAANGLVGLEIAEYEAHWSSGRPGDPTLLVQTVWPLLGANALGLD